MTNVVRLAPISYVDYGACLHAIAPTLLTYLPDPDGRIRSNPPPTHIQMNDAETAYGYGFDPFMPFDRVLATIAHIKYVLDWGTHSKNLEQLVRLAPVRIDFYVEGKDPAVYMARVKGLLPFRRGSRYWLLSATDGTLVET